MEMIKANGLSKTFRVAHRRPGLLGAMRSVVDPEVRKVEAVHDLSLSVERGEMIGLVGPNGAGKSTTIKMLTGILVHSGGDLAAALLHDPELLYLDEPTIGLDVVARARIREFLLMINATRGVTVLLTTHDMDDVEALCQRMLIIDHGRKLFDGAVSNIRERFGGERALVAGLDSTALATLPHDANGQPIIADLPMGVRMVRAEEPRIWLGFSRDAIPAHELVAWLGARYSLRDV